MQTLDVNITAHLWSLAVGVLIGGLMVANAMRGKSEDES
jgi:1,4-dihydroxy-2-naphthoate octaprenyltransferase